MDTIAIMFLEEEVLLQENLYDLICAARSGGKTLGALSSAINILTIGGQQEP